jgi:hypothetical protein
MSVQGTFDLSLSDQQRYIDRSNQWKRKILISITPILALRTYRFLVIWNSYVKFVARDYSNRRRLVNWFLFVQNYKYFINLVCPILVTGNCIIHTFRVINEKALAVLSGRKAYAKSENWSVLGTYVIQNRFK